MGHSNPKTARFFDWEVVAILFFCGMIIGLLNGFFGSGGGILAVALLERRGLSARQAHATSVALILPLSVISLAVYWMHGSIRLGQGLPFLLPALLGSAVGAWGLKKISAPLLKLLFSLLILYSAIRLLIR